MIIPVSILILFNLVNSRVDAYRILKDKTIAHGINFGAYFIVFIGLVIWYKLYLESWVIPVFALSTFCNRQLTFDIPLNLRRKKPWNYVSTAERPAAWLDRQEIKIWGRNGTTPVIWYTGIFLLTTTLLFLWRRF